MTIRPLKDHVVLKRIEEKEVTSGGLYIPQNAKEKPFEGEVIAVGSGRTLDNGQLLPLEIKVGDRVLFTKYGGNEVKIDGVEHLIMREEDILGVVI
jgi:chaperonin GroES